MGEADTGSPKIVCSLVLWLVAEFGIEIGQIHRSRIVTAVGESQPKFGFVIACCSLIADLPQDLHDLVGKLFFSRLASEAVKQAHRDVS